MITDNTLAIMLVLLITTHIALVAITLSLVVEHL